MADIQIKSIEIPDLAQRLEERPLDLYKETAARMAAQGVEESPTISRVLEFLSPSEKGDELDAFGRLMRQAGIITRSDPEAGIWASPADSFMKKGNLGRLLMTEFFARQWRKAVFSNKMPAEERAIFLSTDGIAGSWQRPYTEAAMAKWNQMVAPAIPLSELIAMTTPISSGDYRSFYLTYNAEALRQFRIGESAEIPIAELADTERTIRLKKYGRGLQASYEQLRRIGRVDKLAFYIRLMAVQAEMDKVAAGLDVLINGDGNSGTTPTTHNLTTLDTAAAAGTLTLKGWLAFKLKFAQPYVITTGLMQEAVILQLLLLNIGSGNVPLVQLPPVLGSNLNLINQVGDGVRVGFTSDAPTLKIVGTDRRFAMEFVTEIGGTISETERFVTNQTQVMTMTEVSGFAIMDPNATRILDVNA